MDNSFEKIERTLKANVDDVYKLMNFDRLALDMAISIIENLQTKLKKDHFINNPHLSAEHALTLLKNIRDNDSLKSDFQVIYN